MTHDTNTTRTDEERPDSIPGTIRVPLSRGMFAIISEKDAPMVTPYKWHAVDQGGRFYAARRTMKLLGKRRVIYLHRLVMGQPESWDIDHINGDTLDNRRENLRVCTQAQNNRNARKHKTRPTSSQFKGVYWCKKLSRWRVTIKPGGKSVYVGAFKTEDEAGRAYDAAAVKHFGAFARLNFPLVSPLVKIGGRS